MSCVRAGVCAFDMGYKNYAFFACCVDFRRVLGYGKLDISGGKKVQSISRKHVDRLTRELRERDWLWSMCSHIVIEKQMKVNAKATRLEHHTQSYLWLAHADCDTRSVGASKKTAMLVEAAAMPSKTKKERQNRGRTLKKNAVLVAERLLREEMQLEESMVQDIMRGGISASKKDDIADCIIMAYQKAKEVRDGSKRSKTPKRRTAKPKAKTKDAAKTGVEVEVEEGPSKSTTPKRRTAKAKDAAKTGVEEGPPKGKTPKRRTAKAKAKTGVPKVIRG